MMASFPATPNSSFLQLHTSSTTRLILNYHQQFNGGVSCRRSRGSLVVTRAGAPGATTYIFAFLFPLSLLAVTIFTSIKISDKLDRDFYQELEVNQSILEAEDEDEDGDVEQLSSQQRTRNRPKREAEISRISGLGIGPNVKLRFQERNSFMQFLNRKVILFDQVC